MLDISLAPAGRLALGMTDIVLRGGEWHPVPDGSYRLDRSGPAGARELLLLVTEKARKGSTYTWTTHQSTLAKMFKVSVRTIQRWVALLREQGRICTNYIYIENLRCATVFSLPTFRDRLVSAGQLVTTRHDGVSFKTKGKTKTRGRKPSKPAPDLVTLPSDRDVSGEMDQDPVPVQLQPAVAKRSNVSPSTTDSRLPPARTRENDVESAKNIVEKKANMPNVIDVDKFIGDDVSERVDGEVDRDSTQEVLRWWIANRAVRPDGGEVAAMARSVKLCLTRSSELRVQGDLYDLMLAGLDDPTHLEIRTGFVRKSASRSRLKYLTVKRRASMLRTGAVRPSESRTLRSPQSLEISSPGGQSSIDMVSDEDWKAGASPRVMAPNGGTFDLSALVAQFSRTM